MPTEQPDPRNDSRSLSGHEEVLRHRLNIRSYWAPKEAPSLESLADYVSAAREGPSTLDRFISMDRGWRITLGRSLDFFCQPEDFLQFGPDSWRNGLCPASMTQNPHINRPRRRICPEQWRRTNSSRSQSALGKLATLMSDSIPTNQSGKFRPIP